MSDTPQFESWNLETAYEEHVDAKAAAEATAFRTVPGGAYRFTVSAKDLRLAPALTKDGTPRRDAGRRYVHLSVDAVGKVAFEGKEPKTKLFFDISPDIGRYDDGKIDKPYTLWVQYAKALGKLEASVGDIVTAVALYPVDGYITEVARYEGQGEAGRDKYETIKADGGRKEALANAVKNGARVDNRVQNVSAAK